jgi:hypothetical protein
MAMDLIWEFLDTEVTLTVLQEIGLLMLLTVLVTTLVYKLEKNGEKADKDRKDGNHIS